MNLPEDTHLAYIIRHEAWYHRGAGERAVSIMASAKGSGGGVAWEFEIEEFELAGKNVTRVKMFDDSYAAFAEVPELFAALAAGECGSLREVIGMLDHLGAADETERRDSSVIPARTVRDGSA